MYSPFERRKRQPSCLLPLSIVLMSGFILMAWINRPPAVPGAAPISPTLPERLARADVLPTPTMDYSVPQRSILFPAAGVSSTIVEAVLLAGGWETRHLGGLVGHLQGTSWLDGSGGNIVLAGHVEDATGKPGPFALLFQTQIGDRVILYDGPQERIYEVAAIVEASPDDLDYVRQDGQPRLTLITCTRWDFEESLYQGRLIVIAEPVRSP